MLGFGSGLAFAASKAATTASRSLPSTRWVNQPKALSLSVERLEGHHLGRGAVGLLVVDVDDGDQVVELPVGRRHDRLPDRALVELAVGEQHVDAVRRALALQSERHADADRQAEAERAARHLHARRVGGHARHRQPAAVAAVGLELVLGQDAGLEQRRVERDGVVAVREQEAVAALPVRVLRPVVHGVEVGGRQHVGDVERLGDVALALDLAHPQRMAADAVGPLGEVDVVPYRCRHGVPPCLSGSRQWISMPPLTSMTAPVV